MKEGLRLRLNATFFIGAILILITFAIQHRGILSTAQGADHHRRGGAPAAAHHRHRAADHRRRGDAGLPALRARHRCRPPRRGTRQAGRCSSAVCSSPPGRLTPSRRRSATRASSANPATDTYKAILYSGLLCIAVYILVPLSFQGALGLAGVMAPGIVDGTGVAQAMASMVGGGPFITNLLVVMLLLALMLAITTAMAGCSRTLYQGSVDGWLPRYLTMSTRTARRRAAMWTDLAFNLILLLMSDYIFVLAVSNVCYIVFNFLNLNAGWIHRIDNAHVRRPWRAPDWLLADRCRARLRQCLPARRRRRCVGQGDLDLGHRGHGPDRPGLHLPALRAGQGQVSRANMLADLSPDGKSLGQPKAGMLPYLTLAGGVLTVLVAYMIFWT